ncbi:MAG TPA: tetratricopeptide repeat protein [Blastocatellia bacterium]|nr:tetratricopeptide repeat protein [Blastocatellia bacterium]
MSLNKSKALRTAEKYVLQGKIPAAIDEYRKVVDADPADLTTINTLGDLYVRAGKIQDAIAHFSRIADSYREGGFTLKAIAMLKKISKLDPTNIETSMKLANLYSQQGLLVEARQQYLQVADAYARVGQTRKALEAYQKIADLDPANTSVRMKLGEIYSREGMMEQAHDAFIMAGTEFLRKGDVEQALNANLKAITINPESRLALTAIATIYTQQGQIDRAINLLCEAFERNPGDVELLTILGRTYLQAGMMDDAERTFLSLVELDRNRYHYLLEVGRKFLQLGDLDRAAEQIDGCLDVLIAKREEDKAIDFLRRILDRDMNHLASLKRLTQIFVRIREDHNLIATLNSLVEAAMRKGDDAEAIAALRELARLEPDEQMHLQRLYNLGVRDIAEGDSPDVIRATGPLDYESAAFDDAFVIRQISEAEIMAGHGQVDHAVEILTGILQYAPENLQVHLKLKDIYLRAGMMDKAAQECFALARIHEARGESARASDYVTEAKQINPLGSLPSAHPPAQTAVWPANQSFDFEAGSNGSQSSNGSSEFDFHEPSGVLDWSRYQTGVLTDQTGFVMVPESEASDGATDSQVHQEGSQPFRYSDMLAGDASGEMAVAQSADMVFSSAGVLPSDTMPRILRDELEGIDFYIAQGYVEIARDTLDRLREEHGDHPEILARYRRLDGGYSEESEPQPAPTAHAKPEPAQPHDDQLSDYEGQMTSDDAARIAHQEMELTMVEEPAEEEYISESFNESERQAVDTELSVEDEPEKPNEPFLIHKESGPLYPDLIVQLNTSDLTNAQFNTSDLLNNTMFDVLRPPTGQLANIAEKPIGTGDLIESIVSSIDSSFNEIQQPSEVTTGNSDSEIAVREPEPSCQSEEQAATETTVEVASAQHDESTESSDALKWSTEVEAQSEANDLADIFEELRGNTGDLAPPADFETHYSLGLAYKDMDLLDEAIEEFQLAFRAAGLEDLKGDYIHCCNMLGVCFKRKQMPKVAIMWFQRGLRISGRTEDEYQALRYEIGLCYEEMQEYDHALDAFMEVYGFDVNYREVSEKIKQLQAAKKA